MLYNKNNVRKTNDKKILHKVGKQWKVVSVALLMAIGGTAVATHAANAQSNNLDNNPIAVQSAINVKPASANNTQSASASSVAPTSFVSGDAGSAASYRANASTVVNGANSASAVVSGYVKSLNARMPEAANFLNGQLASAQAVENNANAKANSYSAKAANPVNQSAVSSLASGAGYTNASDYVNYVVAPSASVNAENASSTANYSEAINVVSAVAQSLVSVNWNNAKSNAIYEVNSLANDSKFMSGTSPARISFSTSVASASTSASNVLSSANNELSSASLQADIDRVNGSASAASLSNDNAEMTTARSTINSLNSSSFALSMLESKANSMSAKTSKVNSALSEATNAANSVANFTSTMAHNMTSSSSSAFLSSLANDYKNGKRASVESALSLSDINNANMVTKGLMASMLSNDGVNVASLYSLYQNKSLFNDVKSVASAASASISGKSLTPANLYSVGDAMSASASSNASSAASVAANYNANNSAALNTFYASSYSADAKSASSVVASLTDKANAGYSTLLGSNAASFDAAVNEVKTAKNVAANYNSLAAQYAKHAQLVAPKFITITKNGLLHKSYNYGDANDAKLAKVEAGQQYQVLAYRIADNGALRFEIQVGNKTGYFTSANGYVTPTYAFANAGNKYTVNVNKDVRVFSDVNRTKATGDTVKAGTPLNVIAVAAGVDNYYGGYSVYEIMDGQYAGDFITSNVKLVSVPQAKANNNNAKPAQGFYPSINF